MKINELSMQLDKIGVNKDMYSIMIGGLPNEKLCIAKNDKWEVYYSERGKKTMLREFATEEEACDFFFNKLSRYAHN